MVEDTVDKLKTKYYGCKMNLMDDPTIFVNKMDRIRAKMKKKGFTIEDEEFLKDVMNRLPRSGDPMYKTPLHGLIHRRSFGEIGYVTTKTERQGKLRVQGTPMMYLGRSVDHSSDTHRFLNPETMKTVTSRDVTWTNKV